MKYALGRCVYRKLKVGHAGTLEPRATGVLLVGLGRATKRVDELQAERKEYVTEIMLGATTPSFDLEHPIDATYPYEHITRDMVESALGEMSGERLQMPPIYSAKKIDGQRAYEYAREGTEVELKKSLITIYEMEILSFEPPVLRLRIECSKGTYIRSIAMELGEKLGSGAHLVSLRRTRSGGYRADEAFSMEKVSEMLAEMKQK